MAIIKNEKTEFELTLKDAFKKNTDYFEMSDGVFWTVEALMKKFDIARSTLYNKARDNNIRGMKVLGIQCYIADDNFAKQKNNAGNPKALEGRQLTSYATLHRGVEDLIKEVRSATIPYDHAESRLATMEALLLNILEHQKSNNKLLNDILNYLTKDK